MDNLLIAAAGLVLVVSAYCDIRFRILPDTASIILVVLAVVRWSWPADWVGLGWSFGYAFALFVFGAATFARGWLGGGDVKLMSATSFFLGANSFISFIVVMSFAGGGISLVMLVRILAMKIIRIWRPRPDGAEVAAIEHTVPYGAAIALAGLYILYVQCRLGVN